MLPTQDQIQTEAYYRWLRRGQEHGFDLADWYATENDLIIMLNYESYAHYFLDAQSRTYFGCKNDRKCRYCSRTSQVVNFKNEAHAIPQLVGNNALFSSDECDDCNKFFSETIEDSFGKLILPLRTVYGISGKSGVPAFKTRDKTARVDVDKENLHVSITDRGTDPLFVDDPDSKKLSATLETQPYVPILVYKCLVKMALAIMPVEELEHFARTLKWLLEPDPSSNLNDVRTPVAIYMISLFQALTWPCFFDGKCPIHPFHTCFLFCIWEGSPFIHIFR